jgi:hypothetical protein
MSALNEQIAALEEKLASYQPLLDEVTQLKRARAALLGQPISSGRRAERLSVEALRTVMRESPEPLTPVAIAEKLAVNDNVVRSHLNRNVDGLYERIDRGWVISGGRS